MTSEQKATNIVNILSRDFTPLIGLDGLGLYVFLTRLDATNLGKFKVEYLADNLNISEDEVICLLNKLRICNLIEYKISKNGEKYNYLLPDFKSISQAERLHCIDIMEEETWITSEQKKEIEMIINVQYIPKKSDADKDGVAVIKKTRTKKAMYDVDLKKYIENRNPDSFPALVDNYYKILGKYFGSYYKSHNSVQEAKLLKDSMRDNNDNPEKVRQMFEHIISDAFSKGKIEYVSNIGRYIKLRPIAYYKIFVQKNSSPKFAGPGKIDENLDVDIKYIKEMYDYFKENNYKKDIIIKDILIPQYGEKSVNKFLLTIGEKNDGI